MDTLPDYSSPKETLAISDRYRYHAPQNDQLPRYEGLRAEGFRLAILIDKHCPPSREKSTAQTLLQQVIQSANAAIAINESQRGISEQPAQSDAPASPGSQSESLLRS